MRESTRTSLTHLDTYRQSIAVVVPARNEEARIARCLSSIRTAASVANVRLQLVVVDDASSDQTAALSTDLGATVLQMPNRRGPLAAWALGSSSTLAPIVFFVDADCQVHPEAFRHMLARFASERVGVVAARSSPSQRPLSRGLSLPQRSAHFSALLLDQIKRHLSNHDFLPIGRLMALRRQALKILSTDRVPCDRAVAHWAKAYGWQIVYEPEAIVYYEPVSTFQQLYADIERSRQRTLLALKYDPLPTGILALSFIISFAAEPQDGMAWMLCRIRFSASRPTHAPPQSYVRWDVPS